MNQNNKTFKNIKYSNIKQKIHNKKNIKTKNNYMSKNEDIKAKENCNVVVMPPPITDSDISALFNGLLGVVKKKFELENKAKIINTNLTLEKVLKELKAKQAECNRLKNEIILLKSQLAKIDHENA